MDRFTAQEYNIIRDPEDKTVVDNDTVRDRFKELIDNDGDPDDEKSLGAHRWQADKKKNPDKWDKWCASHFCGQVRIGEDNPIIFKVTPKEDESMDFFQMFLACLEHPVVSEHLDRCYEIYFNQSPIPVENQEEQEITLFIISRYLKSLDDLCKKFLRFNYETTEQNLIGKFKGKMLIHKQIKQNLAHARPHYIFCRYQVFTKDCLENRILKAAMIQCKKYLSSIGKSRIDILHRWLSYASMSLEDVATKRIYLYEMKEAFIKSKGFYRMYAEPLRLAEAIMKRFSFDPSADMAEKMKACPPYWIDMNELFERYCETKLRNIFPALYATYNAKEKGHNEGFNSAIGEIRPDYLLKENGWILDAKYKYRYSNQWDKEDLQQLCLYARNKNIREKIGLGMEHPDSEPPLIILYPEKDKEPSISYRNACDDFEKKLNKAEWTEDNEAKHFKNIYKIGVPLPKR